MEELHMLRISLTEQEIADLKKLRLNRNTNVGERANYVLLANEGKSAPSLAMQLNRNIHTIRLWLRRYIAEGISGLVSIKQPGRPAKKAPVIEEQIEELLSKSPKDYGYQEAGWQINILQDWFSRQDCKACHNTIKKALSKKSFVYKRFSKCMPKNTLSSEDKQASISKLVDKIRTSVNKDTEIFFEDESHFSNQPYVSRGWFKKGKKKQ